MPAKRNYAGRTFGQVTPSGPSATKPGHWTGFCRCGNAVEKRIDNLTRAGNHTCGKCYVAAPTNVTGLEERVRRLEEVFALLRQDVLTGTVVPAESPSSRSSEDMSDYQIDLVGNLLASDVGGEPGRTWLSNVTYDTVGELWEARKLDGRAFFWGLTEEEAAYAARMYLEGIRATSNRRMIADDELSISDQRRDEIRGEMSREL